MAFLCPSRRGRQKKKHKEPKAPFLGRITGSASIDTLVRVGLEKQHGLAPDARMRVTQDFLATRKDELGAQKGDSLYKLYQDGDWVYAITDMGHEGFIPTICVAAVNDKTPSSGGDKSKRNSYSATSDNETGLKHPNSNYPYASQNGNASGTRLAVPNHLSSRRRNSTGLDLSIQAETGSDVSSSSLSQGLISPDTINPLPKPSRSRNNIPDVVSPTNNPQKTSVSSADINNAILKNSPNLSDNNIRNIPNGIVGSHGNNNDFRDSRKQPKPSSSSIEDNNSIGIDKSATNFLSPDTAKAGFRSSRASTGDSITEVKTFVKTIGQKLVVVFSFRATDENDVTVERGEVVTVLNDKDSHWAWVKKRNGKEGFVPSAFMCSIPENLLPTSSFSGKHSETGPQEVTTRRPAQNHDVRELYTLHPFTAQSADDICVEAGEQVFADLANQIERDWLWVYAPANQCYGYIPKDNVSLPPDSLASPMPNTDTRHDRYSYH